MFRHSIVELSRLSTIPVRRTIATTSSKMAEGDAGAPRSGGVAQDDAFTKREKASEDLYIRQGEKEKLRQIKEKIKQQQEHLSELDKTITEQIDQSKGQGEEK